MDEERLNSFCLTILSLAPIILATAFRFWTSNMGLHDYSERMTYTCLIILSDRLLFKQQLLSLILSTEVNKATSTQYIKIREIRTHAFGNPGANLNRNLGINAIGLERLVRIEFFLWHQHHAWELVLQGLLHT